MAQISGVSDAGLPFFLIPGSEAAYFCFLLSFPWPLVEVGH